MAWWLMWAFLDSLFADIWKLISLQAPEDSSVLSQVLSDGIDWHPSPPSHFVVVVVSGCFLPLRLWEHNCTVSVTCRCTQILSILQVCAVTFIIAILFGNTCFRVQNFFFFSSPDFSGDSNIVHLWTAMCNEVLLLDNTCSPCWYHCGSVKGKIICWRFSFPSAALELFDNAFLSTSLMELFDNAFLLFRK